MNKNKNPAIPSPALALVRQRHTAFGGAERFVDRAVEALGREGVAVTLVARRWRENNPNLTMARCDPIYLGRLWRDWSFARCVQKRWLNRPGWLVQSHERIPGCSLYRAGDGVHAVWLAHRRRIQTPWQRWFTRINPYHRYLLAMEKKLFEHPNLKAVICNSNMVRQEILSRFTLGAEKLHVIYSGVDIDHFHPGLRNTFRREARLEWGIPDEVVLFLFVGSGFTRKGLGMLLKALSQVQNSWLMVVGRDTHCQRFKGQAATLGIESRVRFAGGQEDVRPFYGAADALVLPTLYDPFPNVVLEAMACGLPLLVSHQCGASDFLLEGGAGLMCDAWDREGLVRHMETLMDPSRRQAMGAEGRCMSEQRTLEHMSGQLLALYQKILTQPHADSPP